MARNSAGLYRRRQYWYFKYKTPAGAWKETTTHCTNYQQAIKARANFLRELRSLAQLHLFVLTTSLGTDPGVSEEIIAGALHPYPPDLVIATKGVPAFRFQAKVAARGGFCHAGCRVRRWDGILCAGETRRRFGGSRREPLVGPTQQLSAVVN